MKGKWKKLEEQYKIAIFATLFAGVITHGYAMTNLILYHDAAYWRNTVGATYSSGRWMLGFLGEHGLIGRLFGVYSIPFFQGCIAIILLMVINCLIVNLLEIKQKVLVILTCGIMTCFPTVITLFGFIYTFDYYMLSVLLSVLAVWFTERGRNGWESVLLPVVFLTLSMGIYQAYISFAASLFWLVLLDVVLRDNSWKITDYLRKIRKYLIVCAGSLLLYLGINKLVLSILEIPLTDYQNIESIEHVALSERLSRAGRIYKNFFIPNREVFPAKMDIAYDALLIIILIIFLLVSMNLIMQKRYSDIVATCIVMGLTSLVIYSSELTCADEVHDIMLYSVVFLFYVPVILMRYIDTKCLKRYALIATYIILGYVTIFYSSYGNRCYVDAVLSQEKAISWMNQLIAQIKSTDGYRPYMQVLLVGKKFEDPSFCSDTGYDVLIRPYKNEDIINSYSWLDFMEIWCGFKMQEVSEKKEKTMIHMEEIENMPSYPLKDSIQIIDDIIVIKMR